MTVDYTDKKVLVTGGTGMIGRQLVDLLVDRGANIYVVSLDPPKGLPESVNYFYADLTDFAACQTACIGMDYVFNLIGVKGSPKMSKEQPADFMVPMLQFNTNTQAVWEFTTQRKFSERMMFGQLFRQTTTDSPAGLKE